MSSNPQSAIPNLKSVSILVAGIGNIFLGDDAFGSEVARRLMERELPDEVRVVDFGICGFDLAYALLDGYDVTIFIDATPRGEAPGTLYTIEPDLDEIDEPEGEGMMVETHGMNPLKVLSMVKSMGGEFRRILLRSAIALMNCWSRPSSSPNARHHPPQRDAELNQVSRMKAPLFAVGCMPLLGVPLM